MMRLEPTNVQQIGDELAIAWNDGTESFLKLEMLRRGCTCAASGGAPDARGDVSRPQVRFSQSPLLGINQFRLDVIEIAALNRSFWPRRLSSARTIVCSSAIVPKRWLDRE